MKRFLGGILVGFLMTGVPLYAGQLAEPPPIEDKQAYLYLKKVAIEIDKLTVVTSNPDGSRSGRRGEIVLLDANGDTDGPEYIEICTSTGSGGTRWRGVAITDTP